MSAHLPQSAAPWQARFEEVRQRLLAHPIYDEVTSLERVRVFMEHHVFAVWDFMSLLKRLQQVVTCVHVPWMPPPHREMARFVNEIVLGEESDEDGRGGHASHFELYLEAMSECGANAEPMHLYLHLLNTAEDAVPALKAVPIPPAVRDFVSWNLELARHGAPHCVAAAFFYGREDVIPEMFTHLARKLQGQGHEVDRLVYYMRRHIELDQDEHGPLAEKLLAELCANQPERWNEAAETACQALESRIALWDAVLHAMRTRA